jgi:hypothetical protein
MRILVAFLLAAAGAAQAQYKCTAADGSVAFQQDPCPRGQKALALDVRPNGGARAPVAASSAASGPAATAAPAGSADKRLLARYAQQDRVAALERELQSVRDEVARRASQKAADAAAARDRYQRAIVDGQPASPADLAAALRDIDDKYRAMAELDRQRLEAAQAAVERARAQPAP